ncbi:MAG: 50S ribosomal protein L11 methyltransferase [Anaerolineales bacterium]|nr:50S ribosomal protein L11 methyltransferase [Anaerolineales bacterium]
MTNWLEVSLTVNGELAEAVAEVLARFAPDGVVTERDVKFTHAEDEGTPVMDVSVRAYLPADDKLEETRQKLEESLYYLGMIQPLPASVFKPIADQNWMEAWKQHYQPIPIRKRLIIIPAWLESPDSTRIAIKIDPGMAFGTGTHPTTQLCLELLETLFESHSSLITHHSSLVTHHSSLIDIGCGSGILSIAALKLGAASALGVDIDEAALKASRENAAANGVSENLSLGLGSVAEVLAGRFGVRQASLVLANILAPVIIRLFEAGLAGLVAEGGTLILSGILQEQVEAVLAAARAHGMELAGKKQMDDWVALTCKHANL